ncbi:MAG: replicative DNA helicase [Lentimicrobium sp.]
MKTLTESQKLEKNTVSYLLNDPRLFFANSGLFEQDLFRNDLTSKKLFESFREILSEGKTPDIILLSDRSGIGLTEVAEIMSNIDFKIDFRQNLQALISHNIEQKLLTLSLSIQSKIKSNTDIFTILSHIKDFISTNEVSTVQRIMHVETHYDKLMINLEDRQTNKRVGIRTGLSKWDLHTGGLQPSDLVIIAAETSNGKTSLALTIAYNSAILFGARIAIFSYEMSAEQLTARLASMESGISSKKILFQRLDRTELEKILKLDKLPGSPIYIDDCNSSSIEYLISGILYAHMRYGVQVVVVDYLQLIRDNSKHSEETEISSNARRLKNIAKELNITVILLSQLSRDRTNPKPSLSRLRGSGQIEEAADVVSLIWRPDVYNIKTYQDSPLQSTFNTAEIIFAKGRNIGVGRMWLNFEPSLTHFYDCAY